MKGFGIAILIAVIVAVVILLARILSRVKFNCKKKSTTRKMWWNDNPPPLAGTTEREIAQSSNHEYQTTTIDNWSEYYSKPYLTNCEKELFRFLYQIYGEKYWVFPQVNLAAVIGKHSNTKYYTDLFHNVDFGLFDKNSMEVVLLIELNDRSHNREDRKERDRKVQAICERTGIPLYTIRTDEMSNYSMIRQQIENLIG